MKSLPLGWRYLRVNSILKEGDKHYHMGVAGWSRVSKKLHGIRVVKGQEFTYIRKLK